jgi:peptide/nickel transport system ATP-binding protein/oligopeptide transport system ATP-binding protein
MGETLLSIENLRTHFFTEDGIAKAVEGVDMQIQAGETLAVVGESGCGKSVTALSIMRLIQSPPGQILEGSSIQFSGHELTGLSNEAMRHIRGNQISMIFQEPMTSLNPVFRAGAQVAEAISLHQKVTKGQALEQAVEMMAKVGISDPVRRARELNPRLPWT